MDFAWTQLSDRKVLALNGADVEDFLDGLVSHDISRLNEKTALYALLLTPQGKLAFDFLLYRPEGKEMGQEILLDVHADDADALTKKLNFYKLRADVTVTPTDKPVFAAWGDGLPEGGFVDPRHSGLGKRFLDNVNDPPQPCPLSDYKAHRLAHLVLEGTSEFGHESAFPLEFRLDELNGIDFQKGCFVGQEVTSRSHRRGASRKKTHLVTAQQKLEAGQNVQSGERVVGQICAYGETQSKTQNEAQGVALLRLDSLKQPLSVADCPITLITAPA